MKQSVKVIRFWECKGFCKGFPEKSKLFEVLHIQVARIGLQINVKKTKSLWLGISEDQQVTLGKEEIDQLGSFTYLVSIISKDIGSSQDVKTRIAKAQCIFSQLKKVLKYWKVQR